MFLLCKCNRSVRVANELGKGDANAVRFSIKVILTVSILMGVIFSALCLAFCGQISYLFSNSVEVSEAVNDLSVILAVSILLNSIQPILSGHKSSYPLIYTLRIFLFFWLRKNPTYYRSDKCFLV